MSISRVSCVVVAAALLVAAVQDHGQTQTIGRILQRSIGLTAIDRGLLTDDARMLDRSARPGRGALRVGAGAVDRLGAWGARYVPGRVIVKFRGDSSTSARQSAISTLSRSASLAARPSFADFDVVEIDPGDDPEVLAGELSLQPEVEYAQAVYRFRPYFVPNDAFYGQVQWNFPAIDLERGWDIQPGASSSLVVAVVDTGMAFEDALVEFSASGFFIRDVLYPALGNITIPFARANYLAVPGAAGDDRFESPYDFIWDDPFPVDLSGHGTHVSGTIGQLTDNRIGVAGIAFNVRLMPGKVIDTEWDLIFGAPGQGTDDVVARGVRYAADNGAKIVNMSIGRTGPPAPVVEDAIRYAVSKGCFVAIAAGNSFAAGNPTEVVAEIASRVDGAVAVGAVDRAHSRAFYSHSASYVELSAPGGSVRSFGSGGLLYQQTYHPDFVFTFDLPPSSYTAPRFDVLAFLGFQGTSMATAHVSGLAALLAQQGITQPAAIEMALKRFAVDRGPEGRDNEFGVGEISARATLRGLGLAK